MLLALSLAYGGIMGKAYANKKSKENRPAGDLYHTPRSLVWVAEDIIKKEFRKKEILDPCCGDFPICIELFGMGYMLTGNDIIYESDENLFGVDYLTDKTFNSFKYVISNPPFSLWDKFVLKSKEHCKKFMYIGRLNYFGTASRSQSGLWDGLKWVMPFNRYVDFQTPLRDDGLFYVGAMATGWFLFEKGWKKPPMVKILDVQKYAKLGQFKKVVKKSMEV